MDKKKITRIFEILKKDNPEPVTELKYKSKFQLLISVILSAQATDKSVNAATTKLFKIAGTPKKLYDLGEQKLKIFIKTIGLYNAKAKNIIKTCKILITEFENKIPSNRNELQKLPGVGRKTANVVLNNAFGLPTIGVDTHVFRVSNRTGIVNAKTTDLTQIQLEKSVPKKWLLNAHHLLILHGRRVCKSQKPHCNNCSISSICLYREKVN